MEHKIKSLKQEIYTICSAEGLFFSGLIVFLGRGMWETTMFPLNGLVSQLCLLLTVLFICLKIVFFDTYSVSGYIGVAIGFGCTILIYLNSGYLNPFFWFLILIGCKDISFEKILKVYLLITVSITILALCAALLGVIENLVYASDGRGGRMAFGSVYVTDFASHIFYMILTFCYLKAGKLKPYDFFGILFIMSVIYFFCKTRLDCASMIMVVIVFGINQWLQKLHYDGRKILRNWEKFWKYAGLGSMLFWAAISFIATINYQEDNQLLVFVDKIISSRLLLGKVGLDTYPIKLWGQAVEMVGAGGTIQWSNDYFFIDCSYIHILLRYGLVCTLSILTIYVLCCYKNINNIYFLFSIALISLNCVIAHHILDLAYNPFASAFLAICTNTEQKRIIDHKLLF